MKIDICLPSYKRVQRLGDMITSCLNTADNPHDINFYVYLDYDDDTASDYILAFEIDARFNYIIGRKRMSSNYWNAAFQLGEGEIVCHLGDDHHFETKGWDTKVRAYFEGKKAGMFYGMDGHTNERCASWFFLKREACNALGYFLPPYFEVDFNDLWMMEVYKLNGLLHFDSSVLVRHNHRNADAKFDDETYRIAEPKRARAAKVWEEMQGQIPLDAARLNTYLNLIPL